MRRCQKLEVGLDEKAEKTVHILNQWAVFFPCFLNLLPPHPNDPSGKIFYSLFPCLKRPLIIFLYLLLGRDCIETNDTKADFQSNKFCVFTLANSMSLLKL